MKSTLIIAATMLVLVATAGAQPTITAGPQVGIASSQPAARPAAVGANQGVVAAATETYVVDDGASESSAGWNVDGDFMWMNGFLETIEGDETLTAISTTWGHPGDGLDTTPGLTARVFVYEDPDDDGIPDDAVKIFETTTTIQNPDTGLFQRIAIDPTVVSGWFFVAVAVHTPSAMYPAPWDGSSDEGQSWMIADRAGINTDDLNANEYPVQSLADWGNPGNWLLRADTEATDSDRDGVSDPDDYCPATAIPEMVPKVALEPNRYALVAPSRRFRTVKKGVISTGPKGFTVAATGGCSCFQIAKAVNAGARNYKYGCDRRVMEDWIASLATRVRAVEARSVMGLTFAFDSAGIVADETAAPDSYSLTGNYPNPFNPTTTIGFDVPVSAPVRLSVFDVLGREVRVLVDGVVERGHHEVTLDALDLPSGSYLYRLSTPKGQLSRTTVLLK